MDRSLVDNSPWDHKDSNTTEWLTLSLYFFQKSLKFLNEKKWAQAVLKLIREIENLKRKIKRIKSEKSLLKGDS